MSNPVTEALLEMHFHGPLLDHFCSTYGYKIMKIYKPSPQKEKWLGFDQAWVDTPLSTQQLAEELRGNVQNSSLNAPIFNVGYFLQYKLVSKLSRRSLYTPPAFVSPHYRVELYTTPDPETSLSQHDILKRISKLPHSNVYYACGMIFDAMDLYESNLDKLRLVDVCQSPDYGLDNDRHFIYFKDPEDSNPIWRSEPFAGRAFSARDFSPTVLRPEEMISYISEVNEQLELLKIEQKEKLRELRNNTAVERRKLEKQLNKNLLLLEERHNRLKKNLEELNILKQHLMEKALEWKSLSNLVNKERHLRAQYLNTVRILNRHKKRLFETALMHTSKELVDGAAFSIEIPPSWRIASLEKKYNEPSESDQK